MSKSVFGARLLTESDGDDDPPSGKHTYVKESKKRRAKCAAFFVTKVSPWVIDRINKNGLTYAQEVLKRTPILSNRGSAHAALDSLRQCSIRGWSMDVNNVNK